MSIFSKLRGQFIDVIEWVDPSDKVMVYRYEDNNREIMMGAQLTVRESQVAIFVNEGKIADIFQPGRYELSTQNMPIMTMLRSWKYDFNSPFKSEVYFVNTKQFLNQKWGTSNPVMMRDSEFGMIRIRAFGVYSFRVSDPEVFLKEVFGTSDLYTVDGVEGQIKRTIVSALSDVIAESKIPALDLAANYDELSAFALKSIAPRLTPLGLKLESVVIENISLPQEVEQAMDKRTSMGVMGDLNRYTQFQAAEALRDAAKNEGGVAGVGAGLGAGMMMNQMMQQAMAGSQPAPHQATVPCVSCRAAISPAAKFCPECGARQAPEGCCTACNAELAPGAKFCPECGAKQ